MTFSMQPAVVAASANAESGLASVMGAGTAAGAPGLLGAIPMGADADSVEFAAVLDALGAAFLAAAAEHGISREMFAASQSTAVAATVVSEAARAAAVAL
ncbi:PE domain-containing protein [Mycolicibacter sinensis]|jgi:hypothetical protein|uniref:PE domain-containing protein n=1 Tax=Mycolicibacter sinensis (strain JDM601) TaxID=875328 RepID=A0A1A2XS12_MYCSD|nr:PE domain-containing protein [Mycolicibacter sinensis]OBH21192.1 hypothetical protein A5694_13930 [Mycolicibacter sinensis]OBI28524.1 hypothetical protein A5710_03130 [Mycolicibacter sinensis]